MLMRAGLSEIAATELAGAELAWDTRVNVDGSGSGAAQVAGIAPAQAVASFTAYAGLSEQDATAPQAVANADALGEWQSFADALGLWAEMGQAVALWRVSAATAAGHAMLATAAAAWQVSAAAFVADDIEALAFWALDGLAESGAVAWASPQSEWRVPAEAVGVQCVTVLGAAAWTVQGVVSTAQTILQGVADAQWMDGSMAVGGAFAPMQAQAMLEVTSALRTQAVAHAQGLASLADGASASILRQYGRGQALWRAQSDAETGALAQSDAAALLAAQAIAQAQSLAHATAQADLRLLAHADRGSRAVAFMPTGYRTYERPAEWRSFARPADEREFESP